MTRTEERHLERRAQIVTVARRQLAEVGPGALSLRAIARELDCVPSAVYRYFSGRDAILTALIIDAYSRLGDAVERAAAPGDDGPRGAWLAAWQSARGWAVANPHDYALLYGTPVIGYQAPEETVAAAVRVVLHLARIVLDAEAAPSPRTAVGSGRSLGEAITADAEQVVAALADFGITQQPSAAVVVGVVDAWTHLFGAISFELFGHYRGSFEHGAAQLERVAGEWADRLGLV